MAPISINGTTGIAGVDGSAGTPALQGSDTNTGIAFGSDVILGSTGGTERFRCDSSGRVLVGTSTARSPLTHESRLQVEGTDYSGSTISIISDASDGSGPTLLLGKSRSGSLNGNTVVQDGDDLGQIYFLGADGSDLDSRAAIIKAQVDGTPGANDMPGRLVFSTTADGASSPTERMRIGQSGNISISGNSGTNDWRLLVVGANTSSSGYTVVFRNSAANELINLRNDGVLATGNAANSPYNLTTGSAANVHIDANGILYRSTSSRRFKTSVESLEDSYADAILSIEPVWYRSTAPGDEVHPTWSYYGFIAEDVAKIDPRLVFWKTHEPIKDEDGNPSSIPLDEPIVEGVQYDRFVPHLLNLIKRQKEQIEAMEARLTALESA